MLRKQKWGKRRGSRGFLVLLLLLCLEWWGGVKFMQIQLFLFPLYTLEGSDKNRTMLSHVAFFHGTCRYTDKKKKKQNYFFVFLSMCWKVRDTFSHFVSGKTKLAPFPTQQNSLLPLKIFPSVFPWDILPPSLPSTLLRIYNIPPPPPRYFSTLASSYHSVRFMALCQKREGMEQCY